MTEEGALFIIVPQPEEGYEIRPIQGDLGNARISTFQATAFYIGSYRNFRCTAKIDMWNSRLLVRGEFHYVQNIPSVTPFSIMEKTLKDLQRSVLFRQYKKGPLTYKMFSDEAERDAWLTKEGYSLS